MPRSADAKPKIHVIGDAGTDTLVVPSASASDPPVELDLPAGASFVRQMLATLLAKEYDVPEPTGSPIAMHALPRKTAALKGYQNTSRIATYEKPDQKAPAVLKAKMPALDQGGRSLVVAHHAGASWEKESAGVCGRLVKQFAMAKGAGTAAWPPLGFPRVLVNLSSGLPLPNLDIQRDKDKPFASELWNDLFEARSHVGIVMSMSMLRAEGAVVARRLSFEHLVEDFCSELHLFPRLSLLARFRHLFVRVGMIAVVHIEHAPDAVTNDRFTGEVYFSPYARDHLHRDQEQEGSTLGRNTTLIAALARALLDVESCAEREEDSIDAHNATAQKQAKTPLRRLLRCASERALLAMKTMDDTGYHHEQGWSGMDVIKHAALSAVSAVSQNVDAPGYKSWTDPMKAFGWRPIPAHLLARLPPRAARTSEPWHILNDVLLESPVHRINVAIAIVMAGHGNVLNRRWKQQRQPDGTDEEIWNLLARVEYWNPNDRAPDFVTLQEGYEPAMPGWVGDTPPSTASIIGNLDEEFELSVPVMQFNKHNLVERDEIESLRSIENLLRLHRAQAAKKVERKEKEKPKPISIAVFGPPGTGKSFAVKQLARAVGDEIKLPPMEFNVAQFANVTAFHDALTKVADKADVPDTTPLVFFDEFDCALDGAELGWLKYFLAPMQDGKLKDGVREIGPAIFVFAGGVHPSFGRFDPRTDSAYDNLRESEEYQQRLKKFSGQKGPDFISRLRGHIDVLPINDDAGRPKHFIRRAMQLRSFLELGDHVDARTKLARINDALVYAFLTADRYRHGVRSMQAILEMCSPIHKRIEIASLPSRAQLEMHVDATEFMVRVHRGRARREARHEPFATRELDWAMRVAHENVADAITVRPTKKKPYEELRKALDGARGRK